MTTSFSETELCVKCGLCLPHCPTYTKTLDENESPRGRLALIQGYAAGALAASPKLLGHLDNCLLCRACEAACPAKVPYGQIMDRFRCETAASAKSLGRGLRGKLLRSVLESRSLSRLAPSVRGLAEHTGLAKLGGLAGVAAGLPDAQSHADWHGLHPATGTETARVALFIGCTAELADAQTVGAAIAVLNRLGVGVSVPAQQVCCGAMALHGGDRDDALQLQQKNLAAFADDRFDAILSIASGCGSFLKEYPLRDDSAQAAQFAGKLQDIGAFLAKHPWPEGTVLKALDAKVLVHTPCTLKNQLKTDSATKDLLKRIPGLTMTSLPAQTHCCGAAGSYMLDHPDMANDLRDDILDRVAAEQPDFLATSNVGCAIHLRAGLKARGLGNIAVVHPVELLNRALH